MTITTPTLNLDSIGSKNALNGVPPIMAFTRALGTATRVNEMGLIEPVAADVLRHDYDPATKEYKGWLIEGARTNTLLQSQNPSITWSYQGVTAVSDEGDVGPDGVTTAYTVTDPSAVSSCNMLQAGQTACADNEQWCLSFRIKKTSADAHWAAFRIRFSGGTAITSEVYVDTDTGDIGTATGGGGSAPTRSGIIDEGDWWRPWMVYTNNATSNTLVQAYFWPAWGTSAVSASTVTTGGKVVTDFQLEHVTLFGQEIATFPSSTIVTTTVAVTRSADVLSTTDLSWFNETRGTFILTGVLTEQADFPLTIRLLSVEDGDALTNHYTILMTNVAGPYVRTQTGDGGVVQTVDGGLMTPGTAYNIAYSYAIDDIAVSLNGTTVATDTDTAGALPSGLTRLFLGDTGTGTRPMFGHIKSIRYWPSRLTNEEIIELTL